tara:strand:- start:1043 stop:1306 length:264 start_codon:yes stop_codon:yes gene_type:complete
MGTKAIHTGELSALPLLMEILETSDGREVLTERLLENLSTTGAGDVSDVSEISYLLHEMVQYALFVNSQDYDIEAAAEALLAAQNPE